MNEHYGDQSKHMPYGPPEPSRTERLWMAVQYYSFPAAVVLLVVGLAAALYWIPNPSSSRLSEEEIQAAIEAHQSSRRTPSSNRASGAAAAAGSTAAEEPSALGSGYGAVSVRSQPSEATVQIDGDSVGTTPLVSYPLRSGVYFVSVEKDGFFSTDTLLILRANESPSFSARLRERAEIGSASSTTRSGTAQQSESSNQSRQVLPPEPQESSSSSAAAPRTGTLEFATTPDQVRILLDGKPTGTTPLTLDDIPAGTHRVVLYRSGYDTAAVNVEVSPGERTRIERTLTQQNGQLRVLAQPWGSIYVDGKLQERNADVWYEMSLPAGTHQVAVVHPALGRRTQTVTVSGNRTQSVVIDLREEPAEEETRPDTTGQDGASQENGSR